jgi:hypothetical protein
MAFLDNSGDIILDAVLTDVGRKRMAQGDFSISKFAIGDDEIDYALYNKDHPSGSAYYDLEILQTPILEAFTQINANINYGLTSYPRQDLLYLPSIVQNQKSAVTLAAVTSSSGVVFLCDDTKLTPAGATTSKQLGEDQSSDLSILVSDGVESSRCILIETGINSTELVGSSANQGNFLLATELVDSTFNVKYDSRFISQIFGAGSGTSFSNSTVDGTANLSLDLVPVSVAASSTSVENYVDSSVNGVLNRVYYSKSSTGTDRSLSYSSIAGPRGSLTTLGFSINPDIPQNDFIVYGKVGQTQGGSETYDYIDTTVYVQGASTNVTLQIPIRIIKLS